MENENETALLKRNEPEPEPDLEPTILKWINGKLEDGREEILAKYHFETEKEKENYLFHNRCKILKPIKSKGTLAEKFLGSHWKKEIEYIKNNKFPYNWMESNDAIVKMNRKHKPLMEICNLLRNAARNAAESQKENMGIISKDTVHETENMKKQKDGTEKLVVNQWPVFCFKADAVFYEGLAEKIGCSISTAKRYINAMTAFKILWNINFIGKVNVLSFGYYSKHNGKDIFHHWVTKSDFNGVLQDFQL